MAIVPLPPDAGTLSSDSPSETLHRGTVAGAVDVVEEDPQAAPVTAANNAMKSPSLRLVIDESCSPTVGRILACQKAEPAAS